MRQLARVLAVLLALLLLSPPAPIVEIPVATAEEWQAQIAEMNAPQLIPVTILERLAQEGCTYQSAAHRTTEGVAHKGIPFGHIQAWSCSSRAEMDRALAEQRGIMGQRIAEYDSFMAQCRAEQRPVCSWPPQ